jgi:NAD(P)-dependent dehydrogenase (short-subunit alcohol dehydrogenase family)
MSDRVALITGGGGGMGSATCRLLAEQGVRIAAADIDLDKAKRAIAPLSGQGHGAFQVDVTKEDSIIKLFTDVEDALGPVAVLVCIAGGRVMTGGPGLGPAIVDTTLEHWRGHEILNIENVFLCTREMLRRRTKTPVADGRIVNMASVAGLRPDEQTDAAYGSAKGAIVAFTRTAAKQAAALGITVNALAPGLIDTPAVRANTTEAMRAAHNARNPLGRMGRDEEVAAAIAFLASPAASYITGVTLTVNGGVFMP